MSDRRPTICIYVPGILTVPGSDNWTGKAVTWTHTRCGLHAEKLEYLAGPLTRPLFERRRAVRLCRTLGQYVPRMWDIVLAGHSNGCDVILDALQSMNWPRVKALHLISAACEEDFAKNGLNSPRALSNIETVTVYVAGRDKALPYAGTRIGRWLGYGILGKLGPVNAARPVAVVERQEFAHGTWFEPAHFDELMRSILLPGV